MSFSFDSPWRGVAAYFQQPIDPQVDTRAAQFLNETVYFYSARQAAEPLDDIVYRGSDNDHDVVNHVFRWSREAYEQVFENGFQVRRQEGVSDEVYFNLENYVNYGGIPASQVVTTQSYAFLGTTLNNHYFPPLDDPNEQEVRMYRYEIYAPGGIWIARTLGNRYEFPHEDEVAFVAGIARQYIRSAQLFIGTHDPLTGEARWRRADNIITINGYFNPQSHPSRMLSIQNPVFDYLGEGHIRMPLTIRIFRPQLPQDEDNQEQGGRREKRETKSLSANDGDNDDPVTWYSNNVANVTGYINSAFRSSRKNEAYIFMKNEYVLLDYAPGTTDDRIINGPLLICAGYPSLTDTPFGEYGIDSAFHADGNRCFIFSGKLCAFIDFAPGTTDDKILDGPKTIAAMFPFFKDTVFENSIDAAFTSSRSGEAYIFKGDNYALIDYNDKRLIAIRKIIDGFYGLRGTIFASGIEAAFASHRTDEAYIFKGSQYALINFAPGTTDDYIIGGVKPILPNWPSLRAIMPRSNRGLDSHENHLQFDQDIHDEL